MKGVDITRICHFFGVRFAITSRGILRYLIERQLTCEYDLRHLAQSDTVTARRSLCLFAAALALPPLPAAHFHPSHQYP